MTQRNYVKGALLSCIITLGLGGLFFHLRFHPVSESPSNFVPTISGFLTLMVVPLFFLFKKTLAYGYVLNGMLAIIGAVTMAHFSLVHLPPDYPLTALIFNTLFNDILIVGGLFFAGKALFDIETFGYDDAFERKGRILRYPGYGWWTVHLIAISLVYTLGNHFWR